MRRQPLSIMQEDSSTHYKIIHPISSAIPFLSLIRWPSHHNLATPACFFTKGGWFIITLALLLAL